MLELDGRVIDPPSRRRAQLLLAYLALNPGLQPRSALAPLLWPDVVDSSARSSLRSALVSLRRCLGPSADRYLIVDRDRVGLADQDTVAVDTRLFSRLLDGGQREAALQLWTGDLLAGFDEDWVIDVREEYRIMLDGLLATLVADAETQGHLQLAIDYARRRVAFDTMAEPPNRQLMRLLDRSGNRSGALAVYRKLADRFRRDLGAPPSAATRALAEGLRVTSPLDFSANVPVAPPTGLMQSVVQPFVGRDRELSTLLRSLKAARSGGRQVALVTGEPGIGKTSLIAAFAARAHELGTSVLYGRCQPVMTLPYQPMIEAIEHYVRSVSVERLQSEVPENAGELRVLIPDLSTRLPELPPPLDDDPEGDRARLSAAILETIRRVSSTQPLLLMLDDMQYADQLTVSLLEQLIGTPRPGCLFALLAARSAGISDQVHEMMTRVGRVEACVTLELQGLETDDVDDLLRSHVRQHGDSEPAAALRARTGGNPLFVMALLESRAPREDHLESLNDGLARLPELVTDVLAEEIRHLAPHAQDVLKAAAVVGDEFGYQLLTRICDIGENVLLDALDNAVAAGLIREASDIAGRYRFRHSLVREVLYDELTATRRAYVHQRIGAAMIDLHGDSDQARVRQIADQLLAAREFAPPDLTSHYAELAARRASELRCHDQSALLFRSAVRVLGAARRETAHRRCGLLLCQAQAQMRSGEVGSCRQLFVEAAELAASFGDWKLQAEAAIGLCAIPFFPGRAAQDSLAIKLLEGAIGALPAAEVATRARLVSQLARERYFFEDPAKLRVLAEKAGSLARESRDPKAISAALDALHLITGNGAGACERLELAGELIDLGLSNGDPAIVVQGRRCRAVDLLELGRLDEYRAEGEAVDKLGRELRQPAYRWLPSLWSATDALLRAPLSQAKDSVETALEAGIDAYGEAAELEYHTQLVWLHWQQEMLGELTKQVDELSSRYPWLPAWRAVQALISLELGRDEAASGILRELVGSQNETLLVMTLLAETCVRLDEEECAVQLYESILRYEGRWVVTVRGSLCLCPASRPLGMLALVLGDAEHARQHFARAEDQTRAVGATRLLGRLKREAAGLST